MMQAMLCAILIALSGVAIAADDKAAAADKAAPPAAGASEPAKPAEAAPAAATEKSEQRILTVEKSNAPPKCEIKPVMTDDELRACGAHVGEMRAK